jgi:hypothetical protein
LQQVILLNEKFLEDEGSVSGAASRRSLNTHGSNKPLRGSFSAQFLITTYP